MSEIFLGPSLLQPQLPDILAELFNVFIAHDLTLCKKKGFDHTLLVVFYGEWRIWTRQTLALARIGFILLEGRLCCSIYACSFGLGLTGSSSASSHVFGFLKEAMDRMVQVLGEIVKRFKRDVPARFQILDHLDRNTRFCGQLHLGITFLGSNLGNFAAHFFQEGLVGVVWHGRYHEAFFKLINQQEIST